MNYKLWQTRNWSNGNHFLFKISEQKGTDINNPRYYKIINEYNAWLTGDLIKELISEI